jgi:hypothetical protein
VASRERRRAKNEAVLRLAEDMRREREEAREKEDILQEFNLSIDF